MTIMTQRRGSQKRKTNLVQWTTKIKILSPSGALFWVKEVKKKDNREKEKETKGKKRKGKMNYPIFSPQRLKELVLRY